MNHLKAYQQKLSSMTFIQVCLSGLFALGCYIGLREGLGLALLWSLVATVPVVILVSFLISSSIVSKTMEGMQAIWQAVWHVSPGQSDVAAPNLDLVKTGREVISSLIMQIYDLASQGNKVAELTNAAPALAPGTAAAPIRTAPTTSLGINPTFDELPVPVIILDKDKTIVLANRSAGLYFGKQQSELVGRNCFDVIKISFTTNDTLDSWIETSKTSKATDLHTWEHVRVQTGEGAEDYKQCDITAAYSKDNSAGHETILTLYDRSSFYNQQDNGMSYIALAVHELRTPLTILRGYIEVFEDELDPTLTPELREFMRKMGAAAQSLTAFVSNILNVARVDENQLVLSLHEANWGVLLAEIVSNLQLRASVRGKHIELKVDPDLPLAAVDQISVYEVVSNLVDNAIKYSGPSPKILVKASLGQDGTIETVVQDFGIGMPGNAIENLFTKYYRSHKSRSAVSGSGLGLYLVKAIVTAHGGRVWVTSKEGEGSNFGFSLQPFSAIADQANTQNKGIERQASGWIKNHTMYR